ncbi:phage endoprotease [Sulfurimicrobium lacus]|uniref:Phage endoprotease n=1 Tax=Sulfurimicrobium lacus TaxID=2715678 RepID=A0A6F8VCJ1_9PROT|nr:endopeptidase [Sulfurimicrobium lacus]BCB27050.1 phage endoprotease [Sulfurimicrobium lacus]
MSNYDPTDIRSQERTRGDNDLRNKLATDTEEADLKWLMGSKRGRRIVWRLLDRAGVFRLSFNTNSMAMAFNEGNKNEGLRTVAQIHKLCPELYPVMVKEQIHDNRNDDNGSRKDH